MSARMSKCYVGFGKKTGGIRVPKNLGFEYALNQCGIVLTDTFNKPDRDDFLNDFEYWYFSSNWVEEDCDVE
jgi:hypothetical protein